MTVWRQNYITTIRLNRSRIAVVRHYPSLARLRNFNDFLDPINNENHPQNHNEVEIEDNFEDEEIDNDVSYILLRNSTVNRHT